MLNIILMHIFVTYNIKAHFCILQNMGQNISPSEQLVANSKFRSYCTDIIDKAIEDNEVRTLIKSSDAMNMFGFMTFSHSDQIRILDELKTIYATKGYKISFFGCNAGSVVRIQYSHKKGPCPHVFFMQMLTKMSRLLIERQKSPYFSNLREVNLDIVDYIGDYTMLSDRKKHVLIELLSIQHPTFSLSLKKDVVSCTFPPYTTKKKKTVQKIQNNKN